MTIGGKNWLKTNAEKIQNPIALDFIEKSTGLVGIMKPIILDFAQQVEKEFGIKDFLITSCKYSDYPIRLEIKPL